jgi:phosphoesterase RecJ-like protein
MESKDVFIDVFAGDLAIELKERLATSVRVVLTGHRSPDGDAVGSCLALWNHLKEHGVNATVVLPDEFPGFISWMSGKDDIVLHSATPDKAEALLGEADVIFVLDYNDSSRVGAMQNALENSDAFKVMIDHHQQPSDFVDMMFSDEKSCSTAEMVYRLIERWGEEEELSSASAACLYCGIMTDSGSFRFPSVTPRTHRIAAALCETGIDHADIHSRVYDNNREGQLKLVGYALTEKLEVFPEHHAAIISLSLKELARFGYEKGDTEGLVNRALSVEGVNFAVFVKESEERVKMSFRSVGEFSAREFSSDHFAGGGHYNAAGGASKESLLVVVSKIKGLLPEYSSKLNY